MVIVVTGPTATGKSELGIYLAKKLNGEIINCDSTQIYKGMEICTNKVNDTCGIVHHLFVDEIFIILYVYELFVAIIFKDITIQLNSSYVFIY